MSLTGKNTLSIRKQEVKEQRSIAIGFKKVVFAHKATAGDTGFSLSSLTSPGSFMPTHVNPNVSELAQVNLNLYQKNLTWNFAPSSLEPEDSGGAYRPLEYLTRVGREVRASEYRSIMDMLGKTP